MRIITNQKLAKRNRQIANYLFLVTLLVLVASFLLVNYPLISGELPDTIILVGQVLALPLAFIFTLASIRMTNLWARVPRPENAIETGLKGLSKKSVLYNFYHFPARHILICPQGVFVFVTRWHDGKFTVEGERWRSLANPISRFFSSLRMDGIGNPTQDAMRAAQHTANLLAKYKPDVEVTPIIIFVDPRAQVEIKDTPVPVLYADPKRKPNLIDTMREISRSSDKKTALPLSDEQIAQFEAETIRA